jgi:hypothetical protein
MYLQFQTPVDLAPLKHSTIGKHHRILAHINRLKLQDPRMRRITALCFLKAADDYLNQATDPDCPSLKEAESIAGAHLSHAMAGPSESATRDKTAPTTAGRVTASCHLIDADVLSGQMVIHRASGRGGAK